MKILWWERISKIRPNQLLKGLKYLWEKCKHEPCLKESFCFQDVAFTSNPLLWLRAAAPASGPWQPLQLLSLQSALQVGPCQLQALWNCAGAVWAGLDTRATWPGGFLSSPCYTWRVIIFLKIISAPGAPTKVQRAQGPSGWHSPDPRQVSAQPQAPLLIRGEKLDFSEPL